MFGSFWGSRLSALGTAPQGPARAPFLPRRARQGVGWEFRGFHAHKPPLFFKKKTPPPLMLQNLGGWVRQGTQKGSPNLGTSKRETGTPELRPRHQRLLQPQHVHNIDSKREVGSKCCRHLLLLFVVAAAAAAAAIVVVRAVAVVAVIVVIVAAARRPPEMQSRRTSTHRRELC